MDFVGNHLDRIEHRILPTHPKISHFATVAIFVSVHALLSTHT